MRTTALVVRVQLPLGWNTYLLFNIDIVNFVWKTDERGAESIALLIFVLWRCLNFGGWGVVEWGRRSYLGPAEIVSSSSQSFLHLNQIWFKCFTALIFSNSILLHIEAVVRRCSSKWVSLRPATLFKRDSNTGVFLWN